MLRYDDVRDVIIDHPYNLYFDYNDLDLNPFVELTNKYQDYVDSVRVNFSDLKDKVIGRIQMNWFALAYYGNEQENNDNTVYIFYSQFRKCATEGNVRTRKGIIRIVEDQYKYTVMNYINRKTSTDGDGEYSVRLLQDDIYYNIDWISNFPPGYCSLRMFDGYYNPNAIFMAQVRGNGYKDSNNNFIPSTIDLSKVFYQMAWTNRVEYDN